MIRTARIVRFVRPAGTGKFGAQQVLLGFHEHRYEIPAYAKKLSELDFLVEIVSALLGRQIDLPIPEPVAAYAEDGSLWFASIDAKYPDLARRLVTKDQALSDTPANRKLLEALADWSKIYQAIGFDEWIANADRNIGNVLFDGNGNFYLIDHNQAMRLPFSPESPIHNHLLGVKLFFTQDEVGKQRIKHLIEVMVHNIDGAMPETIAAGLRERYRGFNEELLDNIAYFLKQRLVHLAAITQQKIPTMQISL